MHSVVDRAEAARRASLSLRGDATNRDLLVGKLTLVSVGVLACAAGFVFRHVDPNAQGNPLPACPFRALTGLYCPGCGSTRCLFALFHGNIEQALAMNPLLVAALPFLAIMLLNGAGIRPRFMHATTTRLADAKLWLWLLLGFAFLRNLPWPPFSWLAPG